MKSHNADITILILAASVLASATPGLPALLALRTTAPWPMLLLGFFTGHLVHWTFEHFFYDALCFAVMASRIPRRQLLTALPFSALTVSLTVILFHPELSSYGGLSGIGCCLFILFAWNLFRNIKPLAHLAIAGILLKTFAECACDRTFFATTGFLPVHAAHFAGAFTGIALLFFWDTMHALRQKHLSSKCRPIPQSFGEGGYLMKIRSLFHSIICQENTYASRQSISNPTRRFPRPEGRARQSH